MTKAEALWELVTEGKLVATNKEGCSVTGGEARRYSPMGWTISSTRNPNDYWTICSNGHVEGPNIPEEMEIDHK